MVQQGPAYRGNNSLNTCIGERQVEDVAAHKAGRTRKKKFHVSLPASAGSDLLRACCAEDRDQPHSTAAAALTAGLGR